MPRKPQTPTANSASSIKAYTNLLVFCAVIAVIVIAEVVAHNSNKKSAASSNTNTANSSSSSGGSGKYYATADPSQFSAEQLFSVIDGARISAGIVALQEDASLDGAANLRAYQVQQHGTSYEADSSSIFSRVSNAVPATTYADEIYQPLCDGATTSSTYASLVGSNAVYQILSDPKYTVAGVGIQKSDPGKCNGYAVIELSDVNQ